MPALRRSRRSLRNEDHVIVEAECSFEPPRYWKEFCELNGSVCIAWQQGQLLRFNVLPVAFPNQRG
jgi:hypothetical protein